MNYCLISRALDARVLELVQSVARLTQTILQALNPSYAEHSPAATIDWGVLNSATWGRSPEAMRELIL